jgi:hypothetical protein
MIDLRRAGARPLSGTGTAVCHDRTVPLSVVRERNRLDLKHFVHGTLHDGIHEENRVKRFLATAGLVVLAACSGGGSSSSTPGTGADTSGVTQLQIEDVVVGTGATAATGDTVSVLYTGTFLDGRVFDASSQHGNVPITFRLGAGQVIAGWDQGLVGMKVGGKRRLTIPPSLAYGSSGSGPIPPNTPLKFEVDLVGIAGK